MGAEEAATIRIIPYEPRFERDIIAICWETGFMGESLAGLHRFDDKRLFALLFALPFAWHETSHCFVAVEERGRDARAVGYILGTPNAAEHDARVPRKMRRRVALRLFFVTWWLHPESFRQCRFFVRHERGDRRRDVGESRRQLTITAPATLHMNVLPEMQGRGIGTRLMAALEAHFVAIGVPGIQIHTGDRNVKAVPFYKKMGYELLETSGGEFWLGVRDSVGMLFVKRLSVGG